MSDNGANMQRRMFKNFLATAKLSKRYHHILMFVSLFFMLAVILYILNVIKTLSERVSVILQNDAVNAELIYSSIDHLLFVVSVSFFIYFLFTVLFVLFIEQKIGGPTVAILKYIEELKKGNYSYARPLRQGDELENIMAALRELQEELKKSSGQAQD